MTNDPAETGQPYPIFFLDIHRAYRKYNVWKGEFGDMLQNREFQRDQSFWEAKGYLEKFLKLKE